MLLQTLSKFLIAFPQQQSFISAGAVHEDTMIKSSWFTLWSLKGTNQTQTKRFVYSSYTYRKEV